MKAIIVYNVLICASVVYGMEHNGLKDSNRRKDSTPKIIITNSDKLNISPTKSNKTSSPGTPVPHRNLRNSGEKITNFTVDRVKNQPDILAAFEFKTPRPAKKVVQSEKK